MKMKTKRKALLLSLCAVLLVVASVMGTMAYLTDKTQDVTNTFSVGNVLIELDEAKVDLNGNPAANGERTKNGNQYKLIPGSTYTKDPTVTVTGGSEASYVRMKVLVKNIDKLKEVFGDTYVSNGVFLLEKLVDWNQDWTFAGYTAGTMTVGDKEIQTGTYEFRYKAVVPYSENNTKLPALFTKITVPGTVTEKQLSELANVEIVITAEAIQAANFADAEAAWKEFK